MNYLLLLVFLTFQTQKQGFPGAVKIKNYHIDKSEVTNNDWKEFVYYKRKELGEDKIKRFLPEKEHYAYKDPKQNFKPIVMISYEQVLEYCKWRSSYVSELSGKKVNYRLPSPEEWLEIAEYLLQEDQKSINKEISTIRKAMIEQPDNYYLEVSTPSKKKISHFFSNVSEMTSQKGIAMGGNNAILIYNDTKLTQQVSYEKPNLYLGFRLIVEMED